MFLVFAFLYAPILVLAMFSFNGSKSRIVWTHFTFDWYKMLFSNQAILSAAENTLIIALVAAAISTVLGTAASFGIRKSRKWIKRIVMNVTNLPMINPEIVTGVSMMMLFVTIYKYTGFLKPGIGTLIIAHTTFCLPYVILSVMPKIRQLDENIYEAARDLGCGSTKSFLKVILPQITSGIITGAIMAFTISLDDFVISYFVGSTTQTLPMAIYSMTRKRISPEVNALSTIFFGVILFLLIIVNFRELKEKQETKGKKQRIKGRNQKN